MVTSLFYSCLTEMDEHPGVEFLAQCSAYSLLLKLTIRLFQAYPTGVDGAGWLGYAHVVLLCEVLYYKLLTSPT